MIASALIGSAALAATATAHSDSAGSLTAEGHASAKCTHTWLGWEASYDAWGDASYDTAVSPPGAAYEAEASGSSANDADEESEATSWPLAGGGASVSINSNWHEVPEGTTVQASASATATAPLHGTAKVTPSDNADCV